MDKGNRSGDMVRRVGRMVEGFLTELQEMAPNELDCLELEREAMRIVVDLGAAMMKEVFRRADEEAPEVIVNNEGRWGNRKVALPTNSWA